MIKRRSFSYILLLTYVVISPGILILLLSTAVYANAKEVMYRIRPATVKQYSLPYHSHHGVGYLNSDYHLKQKDTVYIKQSPALSGDIFQIEASDATDGMKYSQPDIAYSLLNLNSEKVPSITFLKHKLLQTSVQNSNPVNFQKQILSTLDSSEKSSLKPMRDIRYLDSAVDNGKSSSVTEDSNKSLDNVLQAHNYDGETTNIYIQTRNNFTDASDQLVSAPSDTVLSYEVPSPEPNDNSLKNFSIKQNTDIVSDVPSHNYSDKNSSTVSPIPKTVQAGDTTQMPVLLSTHIYIDYVNHTNFTDSIVTTSIFPPTNSDENVTNALPSTNSEEKLSSGTVAGIVIAVLVSVTLLSSAVIYLLYRKFNGKCTSVVESKFNTDNCGYLDDSLRSSIYLNNHIELPKESSEEMTSLDNDSFLNSLETMTIQNYWADNSKNTKV